MKKLFLSLVVLLALPAAALAQDEIEAAYNKYHRAAVAGNVEEAAKFSTAARQKDMTGLSGELRASAVTMTNSNMPRAYLVASKVVSPTGRSALLLASGPEQSMRYREPRTVYGTIRMAMEGADWKVAEASWSLEKPAGFDAAKAAAKAAAQAAARPKPAPASRQSFATQGPTFKLGEQKEPCVFKPVMTAEDMERCK